LKEEKKSKRGRKGGTKKVFRKVWDEEGREAFRQKLGRIETVSGEIREVIEKTEGRMRKVIEEIEREREGVGRKTKDWWDNECKAKKEKMRKALKEWRKGRMEGKEYRREKREYKEIYVKCDVKRREENKRWKKETEETKTKSQVWGSK